MKPFDCGRSGAGDARVFDLDAAGTLDSARRSTVVAGRDHRTRLIGCSSSGGSLGPIVVSSGLLILRPAGVDGRGPVRSRAAHRDRLVSCRVVERRVTVSTARARSRCSRTRDQGPSEHLRTRTSRDLRGATLDLREAHIDGEASVDALAMFGGWTSWYEGVAGLGRRHADPRRVRGQDHGRRSSRRRPGADVHATAILGGVA